MKNTFKTKRSKVNNMYPYIVINEKGEECFLFEITLNTRFRDIEKIEKFFKDDSKIIFATLDENIFKNIIAVTACNIFELEFRKKRPLYYYNENKFFKTVEIQEDLIDFSGCERLKITKSVEEIKIINSLNKVETDKK